MPVHAACTRDLAIHCGQSFSFDLSHTSYSRKSHCPSHGREGCLESLYSTPKLGHGNGFGIWECNITTQKGTARPKQQPPTSHIRASLVSPFLLLSTYICLQHVLPEQNSTQPGSISIFQLSAYSNKCPSKTPLSSAIFLLKVSCTAKLHTAAARL